MCLEWSMVLGPRTYRIYNYIKGNGKGGSATSKVIELSAFQGLRLSTVRGL